MIKALIIQNPKSEGAQHRFNGIGLTPAEEALFLKVNQIIYKLNGEELDAKNERTE